jgi:hypothetical protein
VRYATQAIKRLQNVNGTRLKESLGHFDPAWRVAVEHPFQEELDALDSLYGNRHLIAHGDSVGLTVDQVRAYYESVQRLIDFLVAKMDPPT